MRLGEGNENPLVLLSAGGTGGHVYPAESLAMELSKRGYRLALVTDRRGSDLGGRLGKLETHRVRSGGIVGKGFFTRLLNMGEILIVVFVVLLLFGASKIPKLMRSMGSGIGEFKKGLKESRDEVTSDEEDVPSEDKAPDK